MTDNNQKINRYLRRQLIQKWAIYILSAVLFLGFMGYALYKEHGSVTEDNVISEQQEQS